MAFRVVVYASPFHHLFSHWRTTESRPFFHSFDLDVISLEHPASANFNFNNALI